MEVEGQQLTDDEIVRFGMLMIFAGGETVEKTLATFVRNLVAHPAQLSALQVDRALMDRALTESLRYTAPTHMIPRKTRSDLKVSGGTIPADAEVICFLGSANRDDRKFAVPDQYNIRRTDLDEERAFTSAANHLAFGGGRHFCLGAMMAKTEVEIAVNRLLDATAGLRFAEGAPADEGLFLRGPRNLHLKFVPTRH
jgi:pulcherriminic acid synthase